MIQDAEGRIYFESRNKRGKRAKRKKQKEKSANFASNGSDLDGNERGKMKGERRYGHTRG